MSINSIFSNSTAPTAPTPGVGPTLNAKDPVNDPVIDDATASISDGAKLLKQLQDLPAQDLPKSGRHHAASPAVSSAIIAYQQASAKTAA